MVVTKQLCTLFFALFTRVFFLFILITSSVAYSAVLPEDRTDVLYHRYEGGGLVIDGPSVLVRKQFKDKISVWGNYYTDSISGASIDLLTQGSEYYEENRTEKSLGFDYLHDRTIFSLSATNSSERDYEANSLAFGVSQEFFGDMTTLSLSFAQGDDEVRENIYEDGAIARTDYVGDVKRKRFGLGLNQVLTPKLMIAFNAESVIDEGFLNNPYRSVRFIENGASNTQPEKYPETRNSDAFAIRAIYYLWYRAALRAEYRIFSDSWGINANNYEIRYVHPFKEQWVFELKYRAYDQTAADFFSDLFPYRSATTFRARDKEMSEFSNTSLGLGISYEIKQDFLQLFDKTSINLYWDYKQFDYANFREVHAGTESAGIGNEPFYSFDANIVRLFFSVTY